MITKKKRSQKQEKSVAKEFDAVVTVASGALWGMKADCRSDKCLIECKTTEKDYYSVTSKVWEKIESEAIKDHGRIPLLIVDLEDKDRLVVFSPKYFEATSDMVDFCSVEPPKSFRVRYSDLGADEFGDYTYSKCFTICGKKRNLLCYMKVKDFAETVKEEL